MIDVIKLRQTYATQINPNQTFFEMQNSRNLIKIKGDLRDKIK